MNQSWRGQKWARWSPVFILFIAVFLGERVVAAPPLTTIQDTLYVADGKPYTGFLIIEWKSFEASDTSTVATQSMTLRIYNGQFKTRLVPTTTATAGAHYRVKYVSAGKQQATEIWQVPPSEAALRVKDVRAGLPGSSPGGGVGADSHVEIEDVVGLTEALEIRPVKAVGFTSGRAAIINGLGELDAASGEDGDCMKVDGFSGSCGDDVGVVMVDPEPPAGNVDGVNALFTLPAEPKPPSSLLLYRNGLLQRENIDFTLSGQNVTFLTGSIPFPGDILLAAYRMSGTNGIGAQVLCGGEGQSTSGTSSTLLASCTIPISLLRAGDRIEIKFDYVHAGSVSAFTAEALWGGSVLLSRTGSATDTVVTGSGSVAVSAGSTSWSAQSWGSSLVFTAGTGIWPGVTGAVTVAFRGSLQSASADTVALRGYSVIRYPVP